MLAKCAEGGAELGHYVDVDASREVPIGKLCGGVLVPLPRGDTGVPPGVAAARPVPCGDIGGVAVGGALASTWTQINCSHDTCSTNERTNERTNVAAQSAY